ncbi:hypothetical protein OQA88_9955 [Cercophora sp. LCS_1]
MTSHNDTRITTWLATGHFTPSSILARLDTAITNSNAITSTELPVLTHLFSTLPNNTLTASSFRSLLQTKLNLALPLSTTQTIFNHLAYLSTLPFPSSTNPPPPSLTLPALKRALTWSLPGRDKQIIEMSNHSRMRTASDHRRLLFQSLADVHDTDHHSRIAAQKTAHRTAHQVEHAMYLDLCQTNHDDDGDEIFHDVLDVLYSVQEEHDPCVSGVLRDDFRAVAREIGGGLPELRKMGIPRARFECVVELVLALQFALGEGEDEPGERFGEAARAVCAAFFGGGKEVVVDWLGFEKAWTLAPFLFDGLHGLLARVFLGTGGPGISGFLDPPRVEEGLLDLGRASQLATFLAGSVDLGEIKRVWTQTPGEKRPVGDVLGETAEEAVLVVSGVDGSGTEVVFGVFTPHPRMDRDSIQTDQVPNVGGLERCCIFQLAPRQDVFRGVVGRPGWRTAGGEITFGRETGVALAFKEDGQVAELTHRVVESEDSEDSEDSQATSYAYEPNMTRGDWRLELRVSAMEVWKGPGV